MIEHLVYILAYKALFAPIAPPTKIEVAMEMER
jgi:hypothetical protein